MLNPTTSFLPSGKTRKARRGGKSRRQKRWWGKTAVVILAAGRGTRMSLPGRQAGSELPKALHPICGRPMLWFLLERAREIRPGKTVVVAGYRWELVRDFVGGQAEVVRQKQLLGSGHAVARAAKSLRKFNGPVLVLYCDTPLISRRSVRALFDLHAKRRADCTLLSVKLDRPTGYGRILRGAGGRVTGIVEENDASLTQKAIREINVGCYIFSSKKLFDALQSVRQNPAKKEYYLTDVVEILARRGRVEALVADDPREMLGANRLRDLAGLESIMQEKILERLSDNGVRIRDPRTTAIDADVRIGEGTCILPNTVIEDGSRIGKDCRIGPFARIRGGSVIGDGSTIGNFVEVVRSTVGKRTFIKHLSYIGDAVVGSDVNIGAGTITANYDGKKKHRTVIKDKAQIGSGTILVAPVTVGRAAKTGAGAVVTRGKNVPDRGVVVGVPARQLR